MAKRTENDINAELAAAKLQYGEAAGNAKTTQSTFAEIHAKIKALSNELDAFLTKGANNCEKCGNKPMGMLKTPAHTKDGLDYPNVWEIGCVICDPFLVEREDGKALIIDGKVKKVKRRSYSARDFDVKRCAEKWNNGEWVEDFFFERMRGFEPIFAE